MLDRSIFIQQWVGCGGLSDHLPIFLKIKNGPSQPSSSLKFNKTWLKDESFVNLISGLWTPFSPLCPMSVAFQFASNIKILKRAIKEWAMGKRFREERELKFVESKISRILDAEGGGMLTMESKELFTTLERRRKMLLQEKEDTWN